MKVKIVNLDDENWNAKYPLKITDVEWTLLHWIAVKVDKDKQDRIWKCWMYRQIGETRRNLYLLSHVRYLQYFAAAPDGYKSLIVKHKPPSPSEYYRILLGEALDNDADLYSIGYINHFKTTIGFKFNGMNGVITVKPNTNGNDNTKSKSVEY